MDEESHAWAITTFFWLPKNDVFNLFLWLTGHHTTSLVSILISHNLCDLWDTMSRHWPRLLFSVQDLPRGAEYFHMESKYPNIVPTERCYLVGFIDVLGSATGHYINLFLVLNLVFNSWICWKLIALTTTQPSNNLYFMNIRAYSGIIRQIKAYLKGGSLRLINLKVVSTKALLIKSSRFILFKFCKTTFINKFLKTLFSKKDCF